MGEHKLTLTVFYMDTSDRFCTNECAHEVRPEHLCSCVAVKRYEGELNLWADPMCLHCTRGRRPGPPLDYAAGMISPEHLRGLMHAGRLMEEVDRE
jgi:hypothetical protein